MNDTCKNEPLIYLPKIINLTYTIIIEESKFKNI
jgi:hypothetical protein